MNALILLVFSADPTGLQAAFESADSVDLHYYHSGITVTLVNPETIRKLAPLIEVQGQSRKVGYPSTREIIRATVRSGKKETDFWMTKGMFAFGEDKMITPADDKLWVALRAYFEPPILVREPRKPGILGELPGRPQEAPPREDSVAKTLKAAFEAESLEVKNVTTGKSCTLTQKTTIQELAGLARLKGEVSDTTKPDAKGMIEFVLANPETRTKFYLLGDTLAWGSVYYVKTKLADDRLYLAMLASIVSEPTPPKNSRDDMTGLMAALESADSMELTHRATGKKATIKGKALKELIPLSDNKGVSGAMAPGNKFLEKKDVIDISVESAAATTKFLLVRSGDDATLVFGPQNLLAKMTNLSLWHEVRAYFPEPKNSAFPARPESK